MRAIYDRIIYTWPYTELGVAGGFVSRRVGGDEPATTVNNLSLQRCAGIMRTLPSAL